uniref:Putative guanine nucleotide exchange factor n=3 Tax=Ixodes ricinus TaxID=34613 RepID=A0A131Y121_IXORI
MHPSEAQMADLRLAPETAQSPLQNGYASCNGSGGFLATDQPQPKSPVEPRAEPSPEPQPVVGPQAQPQTRPEMDSDPQMKEVPEPQLELQPQPKPVVCGTAVIVSGPRRSASDGAMRDIAAVGRQSPPASVERARSHSDSDERVAMLRARIGRRFEQLEEDRRAALRSSRVTQSSSASSTTTEGPDTPTPLHDLCSPGEPCESLRWGSASRPRSVSVAEVKELAYARLQAELSRAQQELKLKDEEVARLSQIRDEVGAELEELTASLFEEANNMVREANIKQATAERRLQECSLKTEVLQAEVQALKALVLTSTPSRPNAHLHPQLGARKHRRSPSNYELATRPPSPPGGPASPPPAPLHNGSQDDCLELAPDACEVDPVYHREFVSWRQNPGLDPQDPFLARIYQEDILPCLHFATQQLSQEVLRAIEDNCITIEAVTGSNPFPKKCSLLDAPRLCKYRMRLGDSSSWHYISQLCRNRITSVCDLFCYLRYIQQGLVRNSIHEVYWEVIRRRRCIALARLGIGPSSS